MEKPNTFDLYKKDKAKHKYDKTYEEHQKCINYEIFLEEKMNHLNYEFQEHNIKIEKINGVVVKVESKIPFQDLIKAIRYLTSKALLLLTICSLFSCHPNRKLQKPFIIISKNITYTKGVGHYTCQDVKGETFDFSDTPQAYKFGDTIK